MVSQFKSVGWQVNPLIQEFSPIATRREWQTKSPDWCQGYKGFKV
jgi:hypothetical protein